MTEFYAGMTREEYDEDLRAQDAEQEESRQMLDQVAWANERMEALGLSETHAILYGPTNYESAFAPRGAILLDAKGKILASEVGEPGPAIGALVLRVETGLKALLTGELL